jgi:hypothetical protein
VGAESLDTSKEVMEGVVQIYTVVEAKSVNELVKLTNFKTKQGWNCIGGMCHTPTNICEADSQPYPYCQSMYRMEKSKKEREIPGKVALYERPRQDFRYEKIPSDDRAFNIDQHYLRGSKLNSEAMKEKPQKKSFRQQHPVATHRKKT